MRLLQASDKPEEVLKEKEFSVMSFYNASDAESVELDALVEGAMKYFENKVRIGDWSKRSVAWFRVDLEATPELALADPKKPD